MRRLIELCADLGGRVLVHGSPKQRAIEPGDSRESALARAREAFAAIAKDAEQAGVTYCIEPLAPSETPLINTVEEAAAMVDAIGSPALRTMIDTCAAGNAESVAAARADRALAADRPGRAHPSERSQPPRARPGQRCASGRSWQALGAGGYAGLAAVEPFVYEPDGPTAAARAIGYLQALLELEPPAAT